MKATIRVVNPSFEILTPTAWMEEYTTLIEKCGRTCYKSEKKITPDSAKAFVKMLIKSGHHSVLEHCSVTVRFICDRSTSHQLVRHRLCSYSQESQRNCNYGKGADPVLDVLMPPSVITANRAGSWKFFVERAYLEYLVSLEEGIKPEDARSVLPNATKTEIVTTANLRQWRLMFEERALNAKAQNTIRYLMQGCLAAFNSIIPAVFSDQADKLKNMFDAAEK